MQVQMVDAKVYRNGNGNRSGLLSSYPTEPAAHVLLYRQIDDVSLLNVRQSIHQSRPDAQSSFSHFLLHLLLRLLTRLLIYTYSGEPPYGIVWYNSIVHAVYVLDERNKTYHSIMAWYACVTVHVYGKVSGFWETYFIEPHYPSLPCSLFPSLPVKHSKPKIPNSCQ